VKDQRSYTHGWAVAIRFRHKIRGKSPRTKWAHSLSVWADVVMLVAAMLAEGVERSVMGNIGSIPIESTEEVRNCF